jgi:hypothetical protein
MSELIIPERPSGGTAVAASLRRRAARPDIGVVGPYGSLAHMIYAYPTFHPRHRRCLRDLG